MNDPIESWLVVGGPHVERRSEIRDRQNLQAFLESRRACQVSLVHRLRGLVRLRPAEADLACCAA